MPTDSPDTAPEAFMSTRQVAAKYRVTVTTVARWVEAGRLTPALRGEGIRGAMWFRSSDVEALTDEAKAS